MFLRILSFSTTTACSDNFTLLQLQVYFNSKFTSLNLRFFFSRNYDLILLQHPRWWNSLSFPFGHLPSVWYRITCKGSLYWLNAKSCSSPVEERTKESSLEERRRDYTPTIVETFILDVEVSLILLKHGRINNSNLLILF